MKINIIITAFIIIVSPIFVCAQKPLLQTKYTADPAPMVHNDTVFLYTSHDEDDAVNGFKMLDWLLFTSTDMVNWTEQGVVASLKNYQWAPQKNGAWAVHTIERNGKFYLYCPMHGSGIGVLVSDSPYGPFHDPLGKALISTEHIWQDFDPAVYIDDDGQAYLYWGNPNLYYVKLNEDMISYSGDVITESSKPNNYQEGPWVWKHKEHYYLAYASTCCPEGMGYAMSTSPTGPWENKGMIVDASELSRGNHPGIVEFKGKTYAFGHTYDLIKSETSTFYERRSVDMDQISYNEDGTIQNRHYWTNEGPEQVGTLNPYKRIEAETMAWSEGVKTKKDLQKGVYLTNIQDGDYTQLKGVDFMNGATKFMVMAATVNGGSIEIRLDSKDGELIGICNISNTENWNIWKPFNCKVKKVKGVHDVYFIYKGSTSNLFNLDFSCFEKK